MWKSINKWFEAKTIFNWGLPWHILIAWLGIGIIKIFLSTYFAVCIVGFIGILYELYQLRIENTRLTRRDAKQDLIADAIGILLGILF